MSFAVETIHLDLPPLAAALSRRLRDAGLPMTPERAGDFARALALVRPITRRRLYWTARSVFLSDQAQAAAFDAVFASIFGGAAAQPPPPGSELAVEHDAAPAPAESRGAGGDGTPVSTAPSSTGDDEGGAEIEVPLAMASDEELLAGKRSTRSTRASSRSCSR